MSKVKLTGLLLILTFAGILLWWNQSKLTTSADWGAIIGPEMERPLAIKIFNPQLNKFSEIKCYTLTLPLVEATQKISTTTVEIILTKGRQQPNFCYLKMAKTWYPIFWQLPLSSLMGDPSLVQGFYTTEATAWFSNLTIDESLKTVTIEQDRVNYEPGNYNFPAGGRWTMNDLNVDLINQHKMRDNKAFHTFNGAEMFIHQWNGIAQEKSINSFLVNVWRHESAYKQCGENITGLSKNYFAKVNIPLNGNFQEELKPFNYIKEVNGMPLIDGYSSPQFTALFDFPDCKFNFDRQEWLCSGRMLRKGELCDNAPNKFYHTLCNVNHLYTAVKPTLPPGTCIARILLDYTTPDGIHPYPPATAEEQNSMGRAISFSPNSGALVQNNYFYRLIQTEKSQKVCRIKLTQSVILRQTVNNNFVMFYSRMFALENSPRECNDVLEETLNINLVYPIHTIIGLTPR